MVSEEPRAAAGMSEEEKQKSTVTINTEERAIKPWDENKQTFSFSFMLLIIYLSVLLTTD